MMMCDNIFYFFLILTKKCEGAIKDIVKMPIISTNDSW